jgi:hypothetical protein
MSRQRDRIQNAAAALGLVTTEVEWEPLGTAAEMCGPSGGWSVWLEDPEGHHLGVAVGYNVDEVIADMELHVDTPHNPFV